MVGILSVVGVGVVGGNVDWGQESEKILSGDFSEEIGQKRLNARPRPAFSTFDPGAHTRLPRPPPDFFVELLFGLWRYVVQSLI